MIIHADFAKTPAPASKIPFRISHSDGVGIFAFFDFLSSRARTVFSPFQGYLQGLFQAWHSVTHE